MEILLAILDCAQEDENFLGKVITGCSRAVQKKTAKFEMVHTGSSASQYNSGVEIKIMLIAFFDRSAIHK